MWNSGEHSQEWLANQNYPKSHPRGHKRPHNNIQSVTVTAGEDATLFCQLVDSKEKLTRITWQKKTRGTLINKDFFVITPDGRTENKNGLGGRVQFIGNIQEIIGTILLKSITLLDEGVYTCIINIFPSGPFEAAIDLNVQVRVEQNKQFHLYKETANKRYTTFYCAAINPVPPVVSVTTDVIPVVGDSEVTLATCTAATAKPVAEVSWSLGALNYSVKVKNIPSEDSDGTSTVKSYLSGVPSKDLNQQKVQCLVKHTSLNKERVLDHALVIHYPPQDVYIISSNIKDPTTSQEFQCVVDANPQPTVFTWTRVNRSLPGPADGSRLTVPLTSYSNDLYLCSVSNQYGNRTDSTVAALQTQHPDAFYVISGDFNHVTLDSTLPAFFQFVDCPTRKYRTIDLLYANVRDAYRATPLPPLGKSDHNLVFLQPQYEPLVQRQPTTTRSFRVWSPEAEEALKDCYDTTDWSMLLHPHGEDIEGVTHCVTDYLNFCMDVAVPTKTVRCFPNNKPWITSDVNDILNQ
ncbi:hypothetical protein NFI96_001185 [Prochilodus magdalenae]|nr:hypothetical protein NFI96_001185 [Prochilodus magdalenae]